MKLVSLAAVLSVTVCLYSPAISARTVRDTLCSPDGDKVIITYDISNSGNQYTVGFSNQQKKLGSANSGKYKDLSKVAVMFFDRTGGFLSDVSITNMVPDAFMVPANVNYEHSSDGYFIVQNKPVLKFSIVECCELRIPIYLAYHAKKGKYKLFGKCEDLVISLSDNSQGRMSLSPQQTQQTMISTEVIETDNTSVLKTLESIQLASELLIGADKLPFSETLQDEIRFLRDQKREIDDPDLVSRINRVLSLYDEKKASLEEKVRVEQKEEENKARREAEAIRAQNDSIAEAQQIQAQKDKKKKNVLTVGAVLLAFFAFVGNQVFQNLRNSKNQKNMAEMQKSIVDKAEAEAKRRSRDALKRAADDTMRNAKSGVGKVARKSTSIKVNGKQKDLSI